MVTHAVTVVVLAGGHATRFPGKLSRPIGAGHEPLVVRVVRQLTLTGRPCILSLREPLQTELESLAGIPAVMDAYADAGPLGGLASATALVQTPLVFAAAGDLVNIEASVIDELIKRYQTESTRGVGVDAVVPRHSNGQLEPLAALYDTEALHANAVRMLEAGGKKVTDALHGLRVAYHDIVPERAALYHNVNTVADLEGVMTP